MNSGSIAGLVFGIVAAIAFAVAGSILFVRRRRRLNIEANLSLFESFKNTTIDPLPSSSGTDLTSNQLVLSTLEPATTIRITDYPKDNYKKESPKDIKDTKDHHNNNIQGKDNHNNSNSNYNSSSTNNLIVPAGTPHYQYPDNFSTTEASAFSSAVNPTSSSNANTYSYIVSPSTVSPPLSSAGTFNPTSPYVPIPPANMGLNSILNHGANYAYSTSTGYLPPAASSAISLQPFGASSASATTTGFIMNSNSASNNHTNLPKSSSTKNLLMARPEPAPQSPNSQNVPINLNGIHIYPAPIAVAAPPPKLSSALTPPLPLLASSSTSYSLSSTYSPKKSPTQANQTTHTVHTTAEDLALLPSRQAHHPQGLQQESQSHQRSEQASSLSFASFRPNQPRIPSNPQLVSTGSALTEHFRGAPQELSPEYESETVHHLSSFSPPSSDANSISTNSYGSYSEAVPGYEEPPPISAPISHKIQVVNQAESFELSASTTSHRPSVIMPYPIPADTIPPRPLPDAPPVNPIRSSPALAPRPYPTPAPNPLHQHTSQPNHYHGNPLAVGAASVHTPPSPSPSQQHQHQHRHRHQHQQHSPLQQNIPVQSNPSLSNVGGTGGGYVPMPTITDLSDIIAPLQPPSVFGESQGGRAIEFGPVVLEEHSPLPGSALTALTPGAPQMVSTAAQREFEELQTKQLQLQQQQQQQPQGPDPRQQRYHDEQLFESEERQRKEQEQLMVQRQTASGSNGKTYSPYHHPWMEDS